MRRLKRGMLGELVGRGCQAQVFAFGDDRVAKVFRSRAAAEEAWREFRVTRALGEAGAPVWRVDEVATLAGRPAIIGERVFGETLAELSERSLANLPGVVSALAEASAAIGRVAVADLAVFERRWRPARFLVEGRYAPGMLARRGVCHGDLRLENVMIDRSGRIVVIDWAKAFHGPLVADAAHSSARFRKRLLLRERRPAARLAKLAAVLAHQIVLCRKMRWPMIKLAAAQLASEIGMIERLAMMA